MKIEAVLHMLALVLAMAALGMHAASRLLFPEAGMAGSIPVWPLLLCTAMLYGRRAKPHAGNERPMNHNQLK